jgi:hypothetical protein
MIRNDFTKEDFRLAEREYLKRNRKENEAAVAGLCAEIAISRAVGQDWEFSWDASDHTLAGKEFQHKSRLEDHKIKTRFGISHKSDYSNITGFIFSKVYLNADKSGHIMTYPDAYDRYYVEGNGYDFRTYGRFINESMLLSCDDRHKISLEYLI